MWKKQIGLVMLAGALMLSGCAKKDGAAAPGQAANDSSGTAGSATSGGSTGSGTAGGGDTSTGGTTSGGTASGGTAGGTTGGTAGGAANGGTAAGGGGSAAPAQPQQLDKVSRDQVTKIAPGTTYEQFVQAAGSPGKLVAESGDRRTYQFQLKEDPKYYVNVVFNKGIFVESSVFLM
ncbi:hypothetical protein ACFFK0_02460 [Paenibacillus chartarius]|uniref:Lipoprotein n=1 Tax=Paenibacillus chartarius TaxID=747481 RepID=A0ABV6DFD0_9BACL